MRIAATATPLLCLVSIFLAAQDTPSKPATDSKDAKIALALSAAPPNIARNAKVVDRDADGKQVTLREGNNGFTCFPGQPGVPGGQPFCGNAAALQWEDDHDAHKPRPTNTEPGIEYMMAGGTDWSASDPYIASGIPIKEPPHWMIMWPFDPAITGLPTKPKQSGTWIMWAGTPWSHLMINQKP
ncbi:MAG TPA: hypothetical protein VE377_17660 [Candidatus Dormibacteraeota bacterium]|nr:hypothetical protein [Candidatus Dormibacteraeota bacterium]